MQVLRVVPSAARRPLAGRAAAYMSQWASASSLGINHPFVFAVPCTDAPKITVSPSDQKVVENGAVTLFCRASGHPTPDVFWRRAGRRITSNHQRYTVVTVCASFSVVFLFFKTIDSWNLILLNS